MLFMCEGASERAGRPIGTETPGPARAEGLCRRSGQREVTRLLNKGGGQGEGEGAGNTSLQLFHANEAL